MVSGARSHIDKGSPSRGKRRYGHANISRSALDAISTFDSATVTAIVITFELLPAIAGLRLIRGSHSQLNAQRYQTSYFFLSSLYHASHRCFLEVSSYDRFDLVVVARILIVSKAQLSFVVVWEKMYRRSGSLFWVIFRVEFGRWSLYDWHFILCSCVSWTENRRKVWTYCIWLV